MPPCVHHKKGHIAITEVIIMLSWNARVVVAVSIVNSERVISICEGWQVVGLAGIVVNELQTTSRKVAYKGNGRTSWSSYAWMMAGSEESGIMGYVMS